MLGKEAVVAEEAPVLVVVLGVHQGGVTLATHETLVMPVAFSVIDQVLDMNGQTAALADLGNRISLKIFAPRRHNTYVCCCQIGIQHSHCILDAFFAFEPILSEEELALFVCQEEPAGPAFEAFLVKSLFFEQNALYVEEVDWDNFDCNYLTHPRQPDGTLHTSL